MTSNAVIPNVEISAQNEATSIVTTAVSTREGNYTIPALPIGLYTVSATVSGFKGFSATGVRVQVSSTTRLNIVLEVGGISESVSVVASNPLLQSESAEVGTAINTEKFLELPFFFFRRRGGQLSNLSSIPVQRFLQGDIQRWPDPIFDPRSNQIDPATGRTIRTALGNNIIPANQLSSVSRNIAALLPAPLFPDRLTNNYVSPLVSPLQDDDNFSLKIDHQINTNHKLFGSFIFTNRPAIKGAGASVEGEAKSHNLQNLNSRFFRLAEDWTVSTTTLNHFVAYINWVVADNHSLSLAEGWRDRLGITSLQGDIFPQTRFSQGFASLGQTTEYRNSNNTEGLRDTVSMIRGRHSWKFGAEFNRHQDNAIPGSNCGGTFNFSQLETAQPGVSRTGLSLASFML